MGQLGACVCVCAPCTRVHMHTCTHTHTYTYLSAYTQKHFSSLIISLYFHEDNDLKVTKVICQPK